MFWKIFDVPLTNLSGPDKGHTFWTLYIKLILPQNWYQKTHTMIMLFYENWFRQVWYMEWRYMFNEETKTTLVRVHTFDNCWIISRWWSRRNPWVGRCSWSLWKLPPWLVLCCYRAKISTANGMRYIGDPKLDPSPHPCIFELLSCDVISANKYSLIHPLRGRGDTQNLSDLFHGQSVTCNQL